MFNFYIGIAAGYLLAALTAPFNFRWVVGRYRKLLIYRLFTSNAVKEEFSVLNNQRKILFDKLEKVEKDLCACGYWKTIREYQLKKSLDDHDKEALECLDNRHEDCQLKAQLTDEYKNTYKLWLNASDATDEFLRKHDLPYTLRYQ